MATNERPSADEIRSALADSGLNLSDDELQQLAAGEDVNLESRHEGGEARDAESVAVSRRCRGILIRRINRFCGIYLQPALPPRIQVCCEFGG